MANKTIVSANGYVGYTPAGSIDPVNDYFLMQQNSTTSYKSINRNTIMGVTGTPADLSTVQSFTNKTIGNTNTITVKDGSFTLQDDVDVTKQAQFQLSGNTTGTTRVYTMPNASSTIADTSTAQTFTNKTLTSPVVNGGTISNASIVTDSITGFTSSTSGSLYGISVTSGVLSPNAIGSTSIYSGKLGLSSAYTGGVATLANSGNANGTMYYINLGGIKMLWGITGNLNVPGTGPTGGAFFITPPSGFFSTIQSVTLTSAAPYANSDAQFANVGNVTPSSITVNVKLTVGSNSFGYMYFMVMGT